MIDNETQSGLHWPVNLFQTSQLSPNSIYAVFDLRRTAGECYIGLTC